MVGDCVEVYVETLLPGVVDDLQGRLDGGLRDALAAPGSHAAQVSQVRYLNGDARLPADVDGFQDALRCHGWELPWPPGLAVTCAQAVARVYASVFGGDLSAGQILIKVGRYPGVVVPSDAQAAASLPHRHVHVFSHLPDLLLRGVPLEVGAHDQGTDVAVADEGHKVGADTFRLQTLEELAHGVPVDLPAVVLPVTLVHEVPGQEPVPLVHFGCYVRVEVPQHPRQADPVSEGPGAVPALASHEGCDSLAYEAVRLWVVDDAKVAVVVDVYEAG